MWLKQEKIKGNPIRNLKKITKFFFSETVQENKIVTLRDKEPVWYADKPKWIALWRVQIMTNHNPWPLLRRSLNHSNPNRNRLSMQIFGALSIVLSVTGVGSSTGGRVFIGPKKMNATQMRDKKPRSIFNERGRTEHDSRRWLQASPINTWHRKMITNNKNVNFGNGETHFRGSISGGGGANDEINLNYDL